MTDPTAILSMIHETPQRNSATRLFRGEPVLAWTLRRLERCERLAHMVIICWEDQVGDVEPIAGGHGANVLVKGPRQDIASVEAVSAVRRWSDGWQGDLRGACDFDLGFHAPWILEAADNLDADAAVLIDPAAALIDAVIIDRLLARAEEQPAAELIFSHTPPGLGGAIVRKALLKRLAGAELHPGHLLHSANDQLGAVAADGGLPLCSAVSRAPGSFKLDSNRQIWRITQAMNPLNGQLIRSEAEALVARISADHSIDPLPRDIVLEMTTARKTRPCFCRPAGAARQIDATLAERLFRECSSFDDVRLTLGGSGDPMLADNIGQVLEAARDAGISAIRIETDLLDVDAMACARELAGVIDILAVHLPACGPQTYRAVMGIDAYDKVLANINKFHGQQDVGDRGTPLLIPLFTPTAHNQSEERAWYDRWPYGVSIAHALSPTQTKLIVQSDGRMVSNDPASAPLGMVGQTPIAQAWLKHPLRAA